MASSNVAAVRSVTKRFFGTTALSDVSLEFEPGMIHALLGENGSGKSTTVRVLSGATTPDSGTVEIGGRAVTLASPSDALAAGIATTYQDSALVRSLTVGENIALGQERSKWGWLRGDAERIRRAIDDVGADIDPTRFISSLSAGMQQVVAVAKAISHRANLLIMDEPTAALGHAEAELLFAMLRRLRSRGMAIVYISHRLSEVKALADTVSVLKDGRVVMASEPTATLSTKELIRAMVGKDVNVLFPPRVEPDAAAPILISGEDLASQDGTLTRASLAIRRGEIVGIAGLEGSGRESLARLLGGIEAPRSGVLQLHGTPIRFTGPREAIRNGVVYIPGDRRGAAVVPNFDIRESTTQSALHRFAMLRTVLRRGAEYREALELSRRLGVKAGSIDAPLVSLSGGNQQKVIVARALCTRPDLMVLCEPTAGVDVAARGEIYHHIAAAAQAGKAVAVASTDLLELAGLCTRVLVIRQGHIVKQLLPDELSEERLLEEQMP